MKKKIFFLFIIINQNHFNIFLQRLIQIFNKNNLQNCNPTQFNKQLNK